MWSRHKLLNMLIYKNYTKCWDIPVAAIKTEMEMISKEEIGKDKQAFQSDSPHHI